MSRRTLDACITAITLGLLAAGCGGQSNIGKVTGRVTLDGQPLADAVVTFAPAAEGSPSLGRTDSSGLYNLVYTREINGAEIGEHKVSITTYSAADPEADPPVAAVPEKVPAKYNGRSELKATVEAGSNRLDFDLESAGEVIQPNTSAGPE